MPFAKNRYFCIFVRSHRRQQGASITSKTKLSELRENAKNGDAESERELFSRLLVRFSYLAKKRVWSQDAEDLAQDACVTVIEKYKSLSADVVFEAWANQVLRNKIGNYLQKAKTEGGIFSGVTPENLPRHSSDSDPQLRLILQKCLKLARKNHLRYFEILMMATDGHKTNDICREHNIKPGHLYVILERSRAKLKACLEQGAISG